MNLVINEATVDGSNSFTKRYRKLAEYGIQRVKTKNSKGR